jgi:cytidylate kinase
MNPTAHEIDLLQLTAQFINSTSSHVFLTGKAGTGKTTFLRNLAKETHKNFVIVAPTGIAALNAQGVTIHSQFLFPFGSFIPERKPEGMFGQAARFYTQQTLAGRHPLNSPRKQVLRSIDLLIIDEVSMLRADILDAIDYRMRSVKGNFQRSFGGVQVLFIGDLFQLPPIVKDTEWNVLRSYYNSMHFFEAQAIKQDGLVYIELEKIFRQQDNTFISILNNLRNNIAKPEDISELNKYYKSEAEINQEKGVITLTTHNRKADAINDYQLNQLKTKTHTFKARVENDFPEHLFPAQERLELKVGTQIMFIKNDTSGENRFFNGKLAEIASINNGDIEVIMDGEKKPYKLQREEWPNKKYVVNDHTKELDEEVVGTFTQYPIKLAWAVTVHKSQGLTFDKAIIDVGQAFAPGQVYVALSRLRSLDGLILRTKINPSSLSSDAKVVHYVEHQPDKQKLPHILDAQRIVYVQRSLATTFDFSPLEKACSAILNSKKINLDFELDHMNQVVRNIHAELMQQKSITEKFRNQLQRLLLNNNRPDLKERLSKGSDYFLTFLKNLEDKVLYHAAEVEMFSKTKTYLTALDELDQLILKTLTEVQKALHVTECILKGTEVSNVKALAKKLSDRRVVAIEKAKKAAKENPELGKTKSGRKKREKGETYQMTYALIEEGMSLQEIADSRNLALSTIESHAVKGIQSGDVDIESLMDKETIELLTLSLKKSKQGMKEIYSAYKGKYSFGQLRMVQASFIKG